MSSRATSIAPRILHSTRRCPTIFYYYGARLGVSFTVRNPSSYLRRHHFATSFLGRMQDPVGLVLSWSEDHPKRQRRYFSNQSYKEEDPTAKKKPHPPIRAVPSTSDPPIASWVDNYLPEKWKPYARLARADKPIGTWLLLWPCFWSTAIAAPVGALPDWKLLSLFGVGAFVMRGAGCTINDMWDRDIDQKVSRTAQRPLAAGDISISQATSFLAAQLCCGLAVLLSLPHTLYCFQWGAASLPLVALYPTTKRYFAYPQLVLGLTFNWGAFMGWAATYGSMDYGVVLPLYLSGVSWTLIYDTIYAHQDKAEDKKLALQSTALTFGEDESQQRLIMYGLATMSWASWLSLMTTVDLSPVVYSLGVTSAYGHLLWQIHSADFDDPHNLAFRFRSNTIVGGIVFSSLAAGRFLV